MSDYYYDNDGADDTIYGVAVPVELPYEENLDFERLIMELPMDEALVLIVRSFGMNGREAALFAGFSSEWVFWRTGQRLKATLSRKRGDIFG